MRPFTRASQKHTDNPAPFTWDYAVRLQKAGGFFAAGTGQDMALCTCSNGHTTRMTGRIHTIAVDGTVHPSYVCPIQGCSFHEMVQLVGWDPTHTFATVDVDAESDE